MSIENPEDGVNFKKLFMALNLLLSEEDVLDYLDTHQEIHFPIPVKSGVSTRAA